MMLKHSKNTLDCEPKIVLIDVAGRNLQ